jgi:hypothetical protein
MEGLEEAGAAVYDGNDDNDVNFDNPEDNDGGDVMDAAGWVEEVAVVDVETINEEFESKELCTCIVCLENFPLIQADEYVGSAYLNSSEMVVDAAPKTGISCPLGHFVCAADISMVP